jgi:hypothetical protein
MALGKERVVNNEQTSLVLESTREVLLYNHLNPLTFITIHPVPVSLL